MSTLTIDAQTLADLQRSPWPQTKPRAVSTPERLSVSQALRCEVTWPDKAAPVLLRDPREGTGDFFGG